MMLWIDTRRGSYGLQQQPGYTDVDTKAVRFDLTNHIRVVVRDLPLQNSQTMQTRAAAKMDPSVPSLYFQPDGFISEDSPQTVEMRETTGETIWITQSRNRLNYEIASQPFQNSYPRR